MEILQQTSASLGAPIWVEPFDLFGREAVMARWRHTDAHVAIPSAEMIRVVLNLASGPVVQHSERGQVTFAHSRPGNVSIMLPYVSSETVIKGQADVLQLFFRPDSLPKLWRSELSRAPVAALYSQLTRNMVALLVAARLGKVGYRDVEGTQILRTLVSLLALAFDENSRPAPAGSGPWALRRVDHLIEEGIDRSSAPELKEMAAAAGWSITHFVRTFKKERGATPHQILIKRRLQSAMDLLLRPDIPIGNVSDTAGFSTPAHFIALFGQRFGTTPGAYQRALRA